METAEKIEQTIEPDTDGDGRPLYRRPIVIGAEVCAVGCGLVAARRLRAHRAASRRRHRRFY